MHTAQITSLLSAFEGHFYNEPFRQFIEEMERQGVAPFSQKSNNWEEETLPSINNRFALRHSTKSKLMDEQTVLSILVDAFLSGIERRESTYVLLMGREGRKPDLVRVIPKGESYHFTLEEDGQQVNRGETFIFQR